MTRILLRVGVGLFVAGRLDERYTAARHQFRHPDLPSRTANDAVSQLLVADALRGRTAVLPSQSEDLVPHLDRGVLDGRQYARRRHRSARYRRRRKAAVT